MTETIMFFCAHNDDQLIGAGGTIAKYAKEGKRIITIIFSFGENALPHLQELHSRKTRVKETKQAQRILGEDKILFLGLKENNFAKEVEEKKIIDKMKKLVKKYKPATFFTHAEDDPHPDHRAVFSFVMNFVKEIQFKGDVFSFNIWNLFINFKKRHQPKLIVDISDTFHLKVEAFKKHKSQLPVLITLMWNVYAQAIMYGLNYHVKYAEVFYKIK